MENIKQIIAKNLVDLRKKHKLTQQELAAKLNYSDKAISRWEHAETLPDIETLCRVCEIYGVRFEFLLQEEQPKDGRNPYVKREGVGNKIAISLIAITTVWLLACVIFVYSSIHMREDAWLIFIWAIPTTGVVGYVCNRRWGTRIMGVIINSLISWSLLLSIYLNLLAITGQNMWMLFLVGVPIQALIILSSTLKENKVKNK